jgi:hypothetical protein
MEIYNMPTPQEMIKDLWQSPDKKSRFMSDPKAYLRQAGEQIPDNVQVVALEDSPTTLSVVVPAQGAALPPGGDPVTLAIIRGMNDPAYKARAIANPKEIAAELGFTVPENLNIRILENTPNRVHVVIPYNPAEGELSDTELEAVAGGLSKAGQAGVGCGAATAGTIAGCGAGCAAAAFFTFGIGSAAIMTGSGIASGVAGGVSGTAASAL